MKAGSATDRIEEWNRPEGMGAFMREIATGTGLSMTETLLWGIWSELRGQSEAIARHETECLSTDEMTKKVLRRTLDATGDEEWKAP
jgi:hypothetical protein